MKLQTAIIILKWVAILILFGFLVDLEFRLMNTKSTVENVTGLILLVATVLSIILIATKYIKQQKTKL